MGIQIIEGERGCREAVDRGAIAVVVDPLRTSTTLIQLFALGASAVYAATSLHHVQALRERFPQALLAGEQGGARIPGFDVGNSPTELLQQPAGTFTGRTVLFSSSAGARRLVEAGAAPELYVGATANARALAIFLTRRAEESGRDVILIPAGHPDRGVATPEDLWAASLIASHMGPDVAPESRALYEKHIDALIGANLGRMLRGTPTARRLTKLGFSSDVVAAGHVSTLQAVPAGAGLIDVPGGDGNALRLVPGDTDDLWYLARV